MLQKGLTKGDGAWGSGKKLSSNVFSRFPKNNKLLLLFRFLRFLPELGELNQKNGGENQSAADKIHERITFITQEPAPDYGENRCRTQHD